MPYFEIKVNNVSNSVQNEKYLKSKIEKIESEINSIISNLSIHTSSADAIKRKLKENVSNIDNEKGKLIALTTALEDIVRLYDTTEKGLLGNNSANSKIREAVSQALQDINEAGKICGMNVNTASYSSDPVNLSNGNYVYEKVCMEYDSVMDMKFRIFYNIQTENGGSLGRGWTHTFEEKLTFQGDRLTYTKDDASTIDFVLNDEDQKYYSLTGETIDRIDGQYILYAKKGMKLLFNDNGLIVKKMDMTGAFVIYEYNEAYLLSAVKDENDFGYTFYYNGNNSLCNVTEHSGRTVKLEYDNGILSKVTDPCNAVTQYLYDDKDQLVKIINALGIECLINTFDDRGRAVRQQFPDGGVVEYKYDDANGQVILVEQNGNTIVYEHDTRFRNTRNIYYDGEESFTYDEYDNKSSYTDKRGNTFYYEYNEAGNLIGFKNPLGTYIKNDYNADNQLVRVIINGLVTHFAEYDENGRQKSSSDALGHEETFTYDENGNLIKAVKADGSEIMMQYDERGNMISITNAMGGVTRYEYNSRNQIVKTVDALGNATEFYYDDCDRIIKSVDALGNVRTYEYDACGNLLVINDVNGASIKISYNEMNKPISITDANGNVTTTEYDLMWNPIATVDGNGNKTLTTYDALHRTSEVILPNGGKTTLKYDANGNLIERVDPEGGVNRIEYDEINRPIAVVDPCGVRTTSIYDELGNVTSILHEDGSKELYEYDVVGNPVVYIARNGYRQDYTYDALGNLLTVSDEQGIIEQNEYYLGGLLKSSEYADGTREEYSYDVNENLILYRDKDGSIWHSEYDCLGRIVKVYQEGGKSETYEYDALGNIIAQTDGEGNRIEYTYSANGELVSVIDPNGNSTSYEYDKNNMLIGIMQKDGRFTRYQRDAMGNIIAIVENDIFRTGYAYDLCGRIISKTENDGTVTKNTYLPDGNVSQVQFADGKTVKYGYNAYKQLIMMEDWLGITRLTLDDAGRIKKVEKPNGEAVEYQWGLRGEKKSVKYPNGKTALYSYDEGTRLTKISFGDMFCNYTYAENGKIASRDFADGSSVKYTYDIAGNISMLDFGPGRPCVEFGYDSNGRKKNRRVTDSVGKIAEIEYLYNKTGSLIGVKKDGEIEEKYEYDDFGNRIFSVVNGSECSYAYNSLNQLVSRKECGVDYAYEYDQRGNLTSIFSEKNVKKMAFNAMGLLEKVENSGKTVEYGYDGFGSRVSRRSGMEDEKYVCDITAEFMPMLFTESGENQSEYLWDGTYIGCRDANSNVYYLNDELSTPRYMVSNGTDISAITSISAFGKVKNESPAAGRVVSFAGYRSDSDTGFMYVNAREYDPETGRFLGRDPVMGMITLPITFNLYTYCMGDPVNGYDPSGEILAWLAGGIVGAAVNVVTKVASDTVKSIKAGKPQFSSWQSYVGTAAGGFTSGVVFATTGNATLAGAAGGAVENLTTGGLSMATGAKGYRKEDGYTWKNLVGDTVTGAASGAASGFAFGAATKYLKIPGITSGRGSCQAVWKQVMTKTARGQIANVTMKTLAKGMLAYGVLGLPDKILGNAKKEAIDWAKAKGIEVAKRLWDKLTTKNETKTNVVTAKTFLSGNSISAACPAEAS